ncbi:hypothetical protein ACLVWU_09215 [Bdellovibrio sp. HCB290]|uniref:hypothetical protein n=1 Tax=Bdellovibrio sp. HCB290 TaxID=3394356 RepID=UPI0039B57CEF
MNRVKWVLLGVTSLAAVALAAEHILFQTAGTSAFGYVKDINNLRQVSKVLQDYELFVIYNQQNSKDDLYLVDTNLKTKYSLDVDGITGKLKMNARTGDNLQTQLWEKAEDATSVNFDHQFGLVTTGLSQCCGANTGYRIYDVKSGYMIISFNSFSENPQVQHPFVLDVPNSQMPQRYIGVISADSTRDQDFGAPDAGKVKTALVKMGIVNKFYQRLQIDMTVANGYAPSVLAVTMERNPNVTDSDKIEISRDVATLWNIDGGADVTKVEGVQIKIILNGGLGDKTVIIPVVKDRLSLDQATVPEGVSLKAQSN